MKMWIGDPCYVLTESQYEQVIDRDLYCPEVDVDETFTCVVYNTWGGDGTFTDQNGKEYIVDSGQLCILPLECVYHDPNRPWLVDCGQVYDDGDENWVNGFVDDHSEDKGLIQFGEVVIQTGYEEEEEEDEEV